MRVFTVTFLNKNYGSFLQAFALQSVIKANGADPVILKQRESTAKHSSFLYRIICFIRPKANYSYYHRILIKLQDKHFAKKFERLNKFCENSISVEYIESLKDIAEKLENNDILLAGSDQIWSMAMGPLSDWYTLESNELPKSIKKYSYAASIGLSELSEEQKIEYQVALRDFKVVSFRESQAKQILAPYISGEVRCDLDPTLLLDSSFWSKVASSRIVDEPYIFIYMLRPDKKLIKMGRQLGKQLHCKVIYTGLLSNRFLGIETVCDAGVEDFLSYIRYADGVITNSFHGTVFSILFQKKFVSVRLADTSSRVENLLSILGMEQRLIDDEKELKKFYDSIDYSSAFEKLEVERRKSMDYIHKLCTEEE